MTRPVVDQLMAVHIPLMRSLRALNVYRKRLQVAEVVGDTVGEKLLGLQVQPARARKFHLITTEPGSWSENDLGHCRISKSSHALTLAAWRLDSDSER